MFPTSVGQFSKQMRRCNFRGLFKEILRSEHLLFFRDSKTDLQEWSHIYPHYNHISSILHKNTAIVPFLIFFLNPHLRICSRILEREEGRGRVRERGTSIWERNLNRLPLAHAPTGGRTCSLGMCPEQESNLQLLVYRTMLQPTKMPGRDPSHHLLILKCCLVLTSKDILVERKTPLYIKTFAITVSVNTLGTKTSLTSACTDVSNTQTVSASTMGSIFSAHGLDRVVFSQRLCCKPGVIPGEDDTTLSFKGVSVVYWSRHYWKTVCL